MTALRAVWIGVAAALCAAGPLPALRANAPPMGTRTLFFQGLIDGSYRIRVSAEAATWTLVDRGLPSRPCVLNDVAWDPGQTTTLPNRGATVFLPDAANLDFERARLEPLRGRDTVALERFRDSVVLHIDDTPNGEDEYAFRIVFPVRPRVAALHIRAEIDGSDELHISRDGARWVHKHWDWPRQVILNGVVWNPRENAVLPNAGRSAFLNLPVDLSTSRLIVREARDLAVLAPGEDNEEIVIHFADNPVGAGVYDLTVILGR